jgi:hypothetical protein
MATSRERHIMKMKMNMPWAFRVAKRIAAIATG